MDYSNLSTDKLVALRDQLSNDIAKYHNFQMVRKIQLNSSAIITLKWQKQLLSLASYRFNGLPIS